MSICDADTVEVPATGVGGLGLLTGPSGGLALEPPMVLHRIEVRAERRQARRLQRRYALLGVSVMLGALGATVVVLDVVH